MKTVIGLCVESFEQKTQLETDLADAREIIWQTLCNTCKDNLRSKIAKKNKQVPNSNSGISIRGKGNAFILSILAVSVALVGMAGYS